MSDLRPEFFRLLDESLAATSRQKSDTISPIFPIIIGDEKRAFLLAETLMAQGFLAPAIRYPTVARGSARIRIALAVG